MLNSFLEALEKQAIVLESRHLLLKEIFIYWAQIPSFCSSTVPQQECHWEGTVFFEVFRNDLHFCCLAFFVISGLFI